MWPVIQCIKKCCMNGMFQQDKSFGGTVHMCPKDKIKRGVSGPTFYVSSGFIVWMACFVWSLSSIWENEVTRRTKVWTTLNFLLHMCLLWDAICSFPVRGACFRNGRRNEPEMSTCNLETEAYIMKIWFRFIMPEFFLEFPKLLCFCQTRFLIMDFMYFMYVKYYLHI